MTVQTNHAVPLAPCPSDAVTPTVLVPRAVAVPEITPEALIDRPAGSPFAVKASAPAALPPEAVTASRTACPAGLLMPCGFVYTVLMIAVVQASAWRAASTMLAFGIGTVPAMFATAMAGHALVRDRGRALARGRTLAGALLVAGATLTLAGPAIVDAVPALAPWMPFLCGTDVR